MTILTREAKPMRRRSAQLLNGNLPLLGSVFLILLGGCYYPNFKVLLSPTGFSMQPGDSVTLVASAKPLIDCDDEGAGALCAQLPADAVLDFHVHMLPPGLSATVDTSLLSPSTRVVMITLTAAPDVEVGLYELSVIASFEGSQLGTTPVTVQVVALPAATGDALAIAAGADYSLVRHVQGLLAWGGNEDGQLGVRDRRPRYLPARAATAPFGSMLVAGDAHSLSGIPGAGWSVFSWGSNSDGQLGLGLDGFAPFRTTPQEIPELSNIVALAAGSEFSLALDHDGSVWAWGENGCGQLGDGAAHTGAAFDQLSPGRVQGLPSIQAIAAGRRHSVALDLDGNVWTWGHNGWGQLGDGGHRFPPECSVDRTWRIDPPAPIPGLTGVVGIAANDDYSLALGDDGTVWIWGKSSPYLVMGGRQPIPAPVPGLSGITAIAAGRTHALALHADGAVWAWGGNGAGQLGAGHRQDSASPVQVSGLSGVTAIAAGGSHSMAVVDCGQVWTWGANSDGQLGLGDFAARLTPVPVPGIGDESDCDKVSLRITATGDGNGRVTSPVAELCDGDSQPPCEIRRVILPQGTSVDLHAGASSSSSFGGWGLDCPGVSPDLTVTLDHSMHCTARFDDVSPGPLLLTVSSDGGVVTSSDRTYPQGPARINCGGTCGALFVEGTIVALDAGAAGGFEFLFWGNDCTGTGPETQVTMEDRRHCSAHYRGFEITVELGPDGGVTSDPAGIACDAGTCSFAPGEGQVALTAVPDPGYEVDAWGGDCSGDGPQAVVSMDADRHCTLAFRRIPGLYFLTMLVDGSGAVASDPAGIACSPTCQALFAAGSVVELTATPAQGWQVLHWLDDCAAPGNDSNQIVLDADKVCRVVFTTEAQVPVAEFFSYADINDPFLAPAVGRVVTFDGGASHMLDPTTGNQDPNGINEFRWDFHNDGTIDAAGSRAAAAVVQYAFQSAGDHPARLKVLGGPFDLEDEEIRTLAVLEAQTTLFGLSVAKAGTGEGAVTTAPLGLLSCGTTCAAVGPVQLETGTQVTLVATPAIGSQFLGWTGTGCTGAASSVTVDLTANRDCTATFELNEHTLSVDNSGGGDVTSDPAGIDCGADCSEVYAHGTLVTLTATNHAGFGFDGWSGCDVVDGSQCEVTVHADRTVTASFSEVPIGPLTLTVVKEGGGSGHVGSINSGEIDCGLDCTGTFAQGDVVGLLATPDAGSVFSHWTGCDDVDGTFCEVNMDTNSTVTASFE